MRSYIKISFYCLYIFQFASLDLFQIYFWILSFKYVFIMMHFHSINLTFILIFAFMMIKREYPIVSLITCVS